MVEKRTLGVFNLIATTRRWSVSSVVVRSVLKV